MKTITIVRLKMWFQDYISPLVVNKHHSLLYTYYFSYRVIDKYTRRKLYFDPGMSQISRQVAPGDASMNFDGHIIGKTCLSKCYTSPLRVTPVRCKWATIDRIYSITSIKRDTLISHFPRRSDLIVLILYKSGSYRCHFVPRQVVLMGFGNLYLLWLVVTHSWYDQCLVGYLDSVCLILVFYSNIHNLL